MKTLVIYYSFEGNTKLMAEAMAEAVGADLLRLQPRREIQTHGFMKFVWGGKAAMMKDKPELLPLDKNPDDYDLLLLGTPVWAWTYAPPMNTFLSGTPLSGKKIALFCCHGGGKGAIFEKMKAALPGNEFLGEIDFRDPAKRDMEANRGKAQDWARSMAGGKTEG